MKKKLLLITLMAFTSAIIALYKWQTTTLRAPSSVKSSHGLRLGKSHNGIHIQIDAINEIPSSDDQEIILRATIQVLKPINGDLSYKWSLPEGVEVVAGHVEDSLANVQAGQFVTIDLTLMGLSLETATKLVTIHAHFEENGRQMAASAVFATRPMEVVTPLLSEEETQKMEEKPNIQL